MLVTALVTPFVDGGASLDLALLEKLVAFQLAHGVDVVLLAGTTGEGNALDESERLDLVDAALCAARPEQLMVSIGGGRVDDVIERGAAVLRRGVRDLLLADCPYSGASSQALRTHWHGPVARALPDARLLPYAVPSRTATEMLPDDLARLVEDHPNVVGVKDATGRLARMTRVRALCGDAFVLLCGDDPLARDAMLDPSIRAHGVCSVVSNVAPATCAALVAAARRGEAAAARARHAELEALCGLVTVTTDEIVEVAGERLAVPSRSRNPLPLKAALELLGVAVGPPRAPLAPMGPAGRAAVRELLRDVTRRHPRVLAELAQAFDVDLHGRLGLPRPDEVGATRLVRAGAAPADREHGALRAAGEAREVDAPRAGGEARVAAVPGNAEREALSLSAAATGRSAR